MTENETVERPMVTPSSARGHLVEPIQPGGVLPRELPLLLARNAREDALENGARAREGRLGVRIVGAPREEIHADEGAVTYAHAVFLEAQEHVPPEEIARKRVVLVAVPVRA